MFTPDMCKRLVELVSENQEDLFSNSRKKDSAAGQSNAWKLVADTLNTEYPDQGAQSVEQVKQKHSNLKKLAKQNLQDQKKSASKTGGGAPMQKQQLFEQVQVLYDGSPSFKGLSSGIKTSLVGSDCGSTPSPAKRPDTSFASPVVKRQKKEPSLEELQREALLGQIATNNKFSSVLDQVAAILFARFGPQQEEKKEKEYKDFSG